MYFYKRKRIGIILVITGCFAGTLYRQGNSLAFAPPEINNRLLSGESPRGWHAHFSSSSILALHNELTKELKDYYNSGQGLSLFITGLKSDYSIKLNYTEQLDHTLQIDLEAASTDEPLLNLQHQITISPNSSLKSKLEAEAIRVSQNLVEMANARSS